MNAKTLVIERIARAMYDNERGCQDLECNSSCTDDLVATLESAWQAVLREFPALEEVDIGDILDEVTVLMSTNPQRACELVREIPCKEYLH